MKTYLETDRLILRDWSKDDQVHFARINSDALIMEHYPTRLDEAASARLAGHFQEHITKHGFGFFAVESKENKAFVGFAGLSPVPKAMPFAPAVEIAWRFDYDFWGKGYGSEATSAILAHGFDVLGLDEIVAYCVVDNTRAQRILEKIGFTHDAKADFSYAPRRQKKAVNEYYLYRMKNPAVKS